MKFELNPNNRNPEEDDLISDIKRVASLLNKTTLTAAEYNYHGRWHVDTPIRHFEQWNKALEASGLVVSKRMNISESELFDNLRNIWILKGRQPYSSEIVKPFSQFDLSVYKKRFGSWRKALEVFVDKMSNESVEFDHNYNVSQTDSNNGQRNVNLRLRFFIMQRDKFKCIKCGQSPATDSRIILHIDHKLPWSKGGKTNIENLQTLCSDCNLGKSNIFIIE